MLILIHMFLRLNNTAEIFLLFRLINKNDKFFPTNYSHSVLSKPFQFLKQTESNQNEIELDFDNVYFNQNLLLY